MKIIVALVASLFLIVACSEDKEAEAQEISIEDLAPLPDRTPKLGITLGTRYVFNADDGTDNKMRMFIEKRFLENNTLEIAWTRTVGRTLNFFRYDTVDGVNYRDTGDIFLEYSRSF